ncbi:MAG: SDR family NAD(P)-dependent oxidoreductase [Candidatus Heimdallarchaeota archaeon]|nr:SDR family NAD(P)-dependent oxidoreductase [Candidatus Heimdallarchaeota archaeon]
MLFSRRISELSNSLRNYKLNDFHLMELNFKRISFFMTTIIGKITLNIGVVYMNSNAEQPLRIIITGASSGIGEATALELAKDKHQFYLTARDEEKLEQVAQKVQALGGQAYIGAGDVGNEEDVERLFTDSQEKMGGIDVIIANAGVGYFGPLETLTIKQFDDQFNTNVRGVFLWLRKVLPKMKEQNKGQIIVTSSNLGLKTGARATIYAATKHAVQAMVGGLREELRGTMVKAATINPGSVSTPWFDGKGVNRENMLTAYDVARSMRFIIYQSETSDVDHIHLLPGKRTKK